MTVPLNLNGKRSEQMMSVGVTVALSKDFLAEGLVGLV